MKKGLRLWGVWIFALVTGTYGMGLVYEGTIEQHFSRLLLGVPTLLLGIWITGNVLASAKQAYRRQKSLGKPGAKTSRA